jgi:hypothetical protein
MSVQVIHVADYSRLVASCFSGLQGKGPGFSYLRLNPGGVSGSNNQTARNAAGGDEVIGPAHCSSLSVRHVEEVEFCADIFV